MEIDQSRAPAQGYIVDRPGTSGIGGGGGQQVRLNDVVDVAEIARLFPISMDRARGSLHERADPLGDDGGVSSVRILPRAEDVEIAQADGSEAKLPGEYTGI